jgi:hypothetical protein
MQASPAQAWPSPEPALLAIAIGRIAVTIPSGSNELQSWPYIILVLGGLLASGVGCVATGLALARTPGGATLVGLLLLVAVPALVVLGGMTIGWLGYLPGLVGAAGIGTLALAVDIPRSRPRAV